MIKANSIIDLNHVETIMNSLVLKYSDLEAIYSEDSPEFEWVCEDITEQICEIEEFILDKEIINNHNLANADMRMIAYWKYIQRKIKKFDGLLKALKRNS